MLSYIRLGCGSIISGLIVRPFLRRVRYITNLGWLGILKLLCDIVLLPVALGVVLFVRFLRPIILIRFGQLRSERIGHFSLNTELYLCEKEIGKQPKSSVDIFCHNHPISNEQLKKMWDRTILVSELTRLPGKVNMKIPGHKSHTVFVPPDRDIHGLLTRTNTHLRFTAEEEDIGQRGLQTMGIRNGSPFVCFIARDNAYLEHVLPGQDWSYHDFRNVDIDTYLPALKQITSEGIYAIRMGAVVKGPLITDDPMVIDYATKFRTDFMDVYLSAKCKYFLTSSTGIDGVSMAFRRPLATVNYVPLEQTWTWIENGVFIPKKLWSKDQGRYLSFREIMETPIGLFAHNDLYKEHGISVMPNTELEILEVVKEINGRIDGSWSYSDEDEYLQSQFVKLFQSSSYHGPILTRIGAHFLRHNQELLG